MPLQFDESYPELLQTVAHALYRYAIDDLRVADEVAVQIAMKGAEAVRKQVGGGRAYIPTGFAWEISNRDRAIWKEFNGRNYLALARKNKLTEERVRQIIKRISEEETANRQGQLDV